MDDKEKLLQKIQELLEKADSYISEINQIKKLAQELKNNESEVKENFIPPITHPKPPVIPVTYAQQKPQQYEDSSNIEKFIGENLINKIGIAVLVLGIGFFVKYAIDKNWINEVVRMFIGIAAGVILTGLGYWIHRQYRAFSSVLTGGGISVLFFTFFIAFREYGILNQTTTFIILIIVTAITVLLSIGYGRRELAIIAIIGGFISPLMVSTGTGNYIVLFSYLFILNIGMLVLAYYKNWNEINTITYVCTVIFYGTWLAVNVIFVENAPYSGALFFGTLYFLLFFVMNIINAFRKTRNFGVFEIIILTSNTFLYYVAGMLIIYHFSIDYISSIFTALLGLFNLTFVLTIFKTKKINNILRYLLIGFTITFLSLVAPVLLKGNYITLFWATEFVILYWLAIRTELPVLKIFSSSVFIIVLISLFSNWISYYGFFASEKLPVVFNKAFLTGMFVCVAIFSNIILLNYEKNDHNLSGIPVAIYRSMLKLLFAFLLYFVFFIELHYQLSQYLSEIAIVRVIDYSFSIIYFYIMLILFRKKLQNYVIIIFTSTLLFITLLYFCSSHFYNVIIRNYYLFTNATNYWGFFYHYINAAIVLAVLFLIKNIINEKFSKSSVFMQFYYWYFCFALVFLASSELNHIVVINYYSSLASIAEIQRQISQIAYPIIWGIASLFIMIIGLKKKNKMLRIISLSLFGIILLKLFLFDIWNISSGGKIAAFVILGVILLLVSFLYQKLKKLI